MVYDFGVRGDRTPRRKSRSDGLRVHSCSAFRVERLGVRVNVLPATPRPARSPRDSALFWLGGSGVKSHGSRVLDLQMMSQGLWLRVQG